MPSNENKPKQRLIGVFFPRMLVCSCGDESAPNSYAVFTADSAHTPTRILLLLVAVNCFQTSCSLIKRTTRSTLTSHS